MVEKIRKKITLRHYSSVVINLCFDLNGKDTLFITITRRYKSLIFDQFLKFYYSIEGNKVFSYISFLRDNVPQKYLLDDDILVVKDILNFHGMKD
jgi:hypothetical protein